MAVFYNLKVNAHLGFRKCLVLILRESNKLYILCMLPRILPSPQQPTLYDFTVSHNAMLRMLTASSSVGNARNRCGGPDLKM